MKHIEDAEVIAEVDDVTSDITTTGYWGRIYKREDATLVAKIQHHNRWQGSRSGEVFQKILAPDDIDEGEDGKDYELTLGNLIDDFDENDWTLVNRGYIVG